MFQSDPSGLGRMLDEFRTDIQYRRQSTTNLILQTPPELGFNNAKRPFDDTVLNENDMLIKKCKKDESFLSDSSLNDSIASQWEVTHLKSQLTQARAEIKTLENHISQLHGHRKKTEQLFEQEKTTLKTTVERDRNNIQQLERRVSVLKKREDKLNTNISSLMEKMNSIRNDKESQNIILYDENMELKHKISQMEGEARIKEQDLKLTQVESKRFETEVDLCNEKVNNLTTELEKLRQTSFELERAKAAIATAQLTIQDLEGAQKGNEEMEAMVKSQQSKLKRYSELERSLKLYVQQNTKLKESCSNVVQLESVIDEMRSRINTLEDREKDLVKIRVDLGVAESKLAEYRALATEAVGGGAGAVQLGAYVRQLQTNSLLAQSQQTKLSNRLTNMEESERTALAQISKLKQEIDKLKEELNVTNGNLRRLKKQNALIVWERNDLRSLIDSCQKEVTISGSSPAGEERFHLLEKLVDDYRERVQQMESDHSLITAVPGIHDRDSKTELEKLKNENKLLKEKVDKLEYEMEHRTLKGDFNTMNTKILHLRMNPVSDAVGSRGDELSQLKKELFETKERLKLYLEGGNLNDMTQEIALRQDMTKEVTELREKVKSQETVYQRLKEAFKTKGHEFREAIYALLGYKVDGLPNSLYRLSSLYAEAHEQHLIFKMSGNGMELLETEYSKTLSELVQDVLMQQHSIPVFLSTLTIDLFKKQSNSMTMSTTSISGRF